MCPYPTVSDCPGYDAWKTDPGYPSQDDLDDYEEGYDDEDREEMVLDCGLEGCCMPSYHFRSECHTPEMIMAMEDEYSTLGTNAIFEFLCRKYVQRADDRQKAMGLQYTEAETHDLARELAAFIAANR